MGRHHARQQTGREGGSGTPLTLDAVYPIVFFDALRVKIRDEGLVKNKAVYVALALKLTGAVRGDGPCALNG
jgi:hypothetical protein